MSTGIVSGVVIDMYGHASYRTYGRFFEGEHRALTEKVRAESGAACNLRKATYEYHGELHEGQAYRVLVNQALAKGQNLSAQLAMSAGNPLAASLLVEHELGEYGSNEGRLYRPEVLIHIREGGMDLRRTAGINHRKLMDEKGAALFVRKAEFAYDMAGVKPGPGVRRSKLTYGRGVKLRTQHELEVDGRTIATVDLKHGFVDFETKAPLTDRERLKGIIEPGTEVELETPLELRL